MHIRTAHSIRPTITMEMRAISPIRWYVTSLLDSKLSRSLTVAGGCVCDVRVYALGVLFHFVRVFFYPPSTNQPTDEYISMVYFVQMLVVLEPLFVIHVNLKKCSEHNQSVQSYSYTPTDYTVKIFNDHFDNERESQIHPFYRSSYSIVEFVFFRLSSGIDWFFQVRLKTNFLSIKH